MQRDAVRLVHDLVDVDPRPRQAVADLVVRLRENRFLLGADRVVEREDQSAPVSLRVLVVQEERAGVPDVEGAARVGGEAHNDPILDGIGEGWEPRFRGFLLLQEFRRDGLELRPLDPGVEGVYVADDGVDLRDDFAGPRPKGGIFREDLADHRLGVRLPAMEERVLQRVFSRNLPHHLRGGWRLSLFTFSSRLPWGRNR